jgi:hypothetical protein
LLPLSAIAFVSSPRLTRGCPVEAGIPIAMIAHIVSPPKIVIAGLDPAIQKSRIDAANFAYRLDCRVKPGNDTVGEVSIECAHRWHCGQRVAAKDTRR